MAKHLKSVFTEDMDHCYFTHTAPVERHHIFGGCNRDISEQYGYVIPLALHLHPNGVHACDESNNIDLYLKRMAQEHFEKHNGSRADFIKTFGRSYL